MYQSKERGRNRVALYRHDMHIQLAERARMLRDLAGAIPNNQLRMMVQPQYDADGQVVGAELLLRWHHPQHGLIMPEKFIGLAEESGLIIEVGEWTLTQACKMYVRLAQAQCAHPISVNVSPVQLKHPGFSQRVSDILAHWDMPPDRLTLEVTEDVLIKDIDETTRCMHALAGQGLRFSIDDFGTGYSGLAYLHRLPLAELKIPKNFVEKLPDEDAGTLIRLITSTARLLELRVVAEGVERAVEAEFLFATGCDAMQGYYHQRPTPMERWVASRLASAQRGIEKHHGNESQHEAAGSP